KEGDKVAYGGVLCIVEAMKVMNEIRADRPCVIRKILVENGKPVSAGQNLFLVDPAS
ncbi:MAG: acetyl-CoA carboxylase, biotin carboxyl carrier protein, partial [Elusimicrobia bacterium]|nr:acetyl-CoA carboxylase, biotin carboxyl carrier protein [Elusimicrobiota bacterium]